MKPIQKLFNKMLLWGLPMPDFLIDWYLNSLTREELFRFRVMLRGMKRKLQQTKQLDLLRAEA